MDITHPFISKQIIAYIGNKRRLLPLIATALNELDTRIQQPPVFIDPFAGSGVVSRLAKLRGYKVYANDWEHFSYILLRAYLCTSPSDIELLFGSHKEFNRYLHYLNTLPNPLPEEEYIARHYAPSTEDPEQADFKRERLFYTRENALIIDRIRNEIEHSFPAETGIYEIETKRMLLIGMLLYKAATHTNTSGVFKAFHKGFGGYGRDALKRILTPITLTAPPLIENTEEIKISQKDANELVKEKDKQNIDITYLDPPYNQHQYGSNYHLLNTIALWDEGAVPIQHNPKGELSNKAGIRPDWVKTRSDYCYKNKAVEAFSELLASIHSRYVLISYSTDGIIPFDTLRSICERKGELQVLTNEYIKYRGGKQSNKRKNRNIEFVFTIDCDSKTTPVSRSLFKKEIIKRKFLLLLKHRYHLSKLTETFQLDHKTETLIIESENHLFYLPTEHFFQFPAIANDNSLSAEVERFFKLLSVEQIHHISEKLDNAACCSKTDELKELFYRLQNGEKNSDYFITKIPDTLQKIAHKKNREVFSRYMNQAVSLKEKFPAKAEKIEKKLKKVQEQATRRFSN